MHRSLTSFFGAPFAGGCPVLTRRSRSSFRTGKEDTKWYNHKQCLGRFATGVLRSLLKNWGIFENMGLYGIIWDYMRLGDKNSWCFLKTLVRLTTCRSCCNGFWNLSHSRGQASWTSILRIGWTLLARLLQMRKWEPGYTLVLSIKQALRSQGKDENFQTHPQLIAIFWSYRPVFLD